MKRERCARGELRLTVDKRGRLRSAEFHYQGKRRGPTLTLNPDTKSGEYRRKGDSHMDSFSGGWARLYTAWSDGPASEGQMSYAEWVRDCLTALRHIGVEIMWGDAERAMQHRRWREAARLYAQVQRRWRGHGGGWSFEAHRVRREGAVILRLLRAVAEARLDRKQLARVRKVLPACSALSSDSSRRAVQHAERLLG